MSEWDKIDMVCAMLGLGICGGMIPLAASRVAISASMERGKNI